MNTRREQEEDQEEEEEEEAEQQQQQQVLGWFWCLLFVSIRQVEGGHEPPRWIRALVGVYV